MGGCYSDPVYEAKPVEAKTIPIAEALYKRGKVRFGGQRMLLTVEAEIDDVSHILLQHSTCKSNPDVTRFAVVYKNKFQPWGHGVVFTQLELSELCSLADACGISCRWVDDGKLKLT